MVGKTIARQGSSQGLKAAVISLKSVSSDWISNALQNYFDSVESVNLKKLEVYFNAKGGDILYEGQPLTSFDCVYIRGSHKHVQLLASTSSLLKDCYQPLSPESFVIAHDKVLTHMVLQQHSVPMPKTYIVASVKSARKILKKLHYPIIAKFPKGTQGKGVLVADTYASASSIIDALEQVKQPFLLQEFIDNDGVDYRLIVAGDKVIAAMKRLAAPGELRSNIHAGGVGKAFEPSHDMERVAVKACKAVKADLCAVDLLKTPLGPVVIEVNISPGLQGITMATGIDVADRIAKFLHRKTIEFKNSVKNREFKKVLQDLDKANSSHELIANIVLRGNRILLPEAVTKYLSFSENEEVVIKLLQDEIVIKRL